MRLAFLALLSLSIVPAEIRTLTLQETAAIAMKQNPEVAMARLDSVKARESIRVTKDPFFPKIIAGTGLAYTSGFPNTIDGSAPSILTVKMPMTLFNRPQSFQAAAASENLRGAELATGVRMDDVLYRAAAMYLDAEQLARGLRLAEEQIASLERVRETVERRVAEGRELEIEKKRAIVNVLKARQRLENLKMDLVNTETSLALVLGYGSEDRVRATQQERAALELPPNEDAAVTLALDSSKEMRILTSKMAAKKLELAGFRAFRLPQVDLVAQYSLLSEQNYRDYFQRFQRHNGQLGLSITVPLVVGRSAYANANSADADFRKLQIDFDRTHAAVSANTRRAYQDIHRAEMAREVARADLDLTREQLSIFLAQYAEGRLPLAKIEETRVAESEHWLVYYDAQHQVERARLVLLRQTGTLQAALK